MRDILLAGVLVVSAAGRWGGAPALAQTVQQQGLRPVDQAVEDIDPTQVSMRRENGGLSTIGERQNVFRRIVPDAGPYDPSSQRLYYVSYGVVAEFDRSQYGMVTDSNSKMKGAILQFIPPNTVFHIGLPKPTRSTATADQYVPGMVQARVDGLVHGGSPYDVSISGQPIMPSQSRVVDRGQQQAQKYGEMVVAQRGVVVAAIQRMSRSPDATSQ